MSPRTLGAAILIAALAAGCKNADDDVEPERVLKVVPFEGKVDSKYVGDWAIADGAAKLDLKADGNAKIESTTKSQAGKSTSRFDGKWLAQDGSLLIQYADKSGTTTLKYNATLSGNKLVLQQPGGRIKSTYVKK